MLHINFIRWSPSDCKMAKISNSVLHIQHWSK